MTVTVTVTVTVTIHTYIHILTQLDILRASGQLNQAAPELAALEAPTSQMEAATATSEHQAFEISNAARLNQYVIQLQATESPATTLQQIFDNSDAARFNLAQSHATELPASTLEQGLGGRLSWYIDQPQAIDEPASTQQQGFDNSNAARHSQYVDQPQTTGVDAPTPPNTGELVLGVSEIGWI